MSINYSNATGRRESAYTADQLAKMAARRQAQANTAGYTYDPTNVPNWTQGLGNTALTVFPAVSGGFNAKTGAGTGAGAGFGAATGAAKNTGAGSNASWWSQAFPNLKDMFGKFFGGKDGAGGAASTGLSMAPQGFDWTSGSGLKLAGKNVGKAVPWVTAGVDAVQAIGDWSEYNNINSSNDDLLDKILISASNNPLVGQYLTADQLSLLNQIKNGTYEPEGDSNFLENALGGLPNAIIPTLLGLAMGGAPGAIAGGIGSLIGSGVSGYKDASSSKNAELSALYQALVDAEAQYKSMRRPNFTGLGIQQQYQNMYA